MNQQEGENSSMMIILMLLVCCCCYCCYYSSSLGASYHKYSKISQSRPTSRVDYITWVRAVMGAPFGITKKLEVLFLPEPEPLN